MLELYKNIPNHHLSKIGRFLLAGSLAFTFLAFIIFWNNQYAFSTILTIDTGIGFISTVLISIGDRRALEEAKEEASKEANNDKNVEAINEISEATNKIEEIAPQEEIKDAR